MAEQLYKYRWGNNRDETGRHRLQFKGRKCTITARGKKNSVCLRFIDNGELLNTSGNALRKEAKNEGSD